MALKVYVKARNTLLKNCEKFGTINSFKQFLRLIYYKIFARKTCLFVKSNYSIAYTFLSEYNIR
jgi:hypothetical protein